MSGLTLAQRLRVTAAVKGMSFYISGDQARGLVMRLDQADAILPRIEQIEARLDEIEQRIAELQRARRLLFWASCIVVILAGLVRLS